MAKGIPYVSKRQTTWDLENREFTCIMNTLVNAYWDYSGMWRFIVNDKPVPPYISYVVMNNAIKNVAKQLKQDKE